MKILLAKNVITGYQQITIIEYGGQNVCKCVGVCMWECVYVHVYLCIIKTYDKISSTGTSSKQL